MAEHNEWLDSIPVTCLLVETQKYFPVSLVVALSGATPAKQDAYAKKCAAWLVKHPMVKSAVVTPTTRLPHGQAFIVSMGQKNSVQSISEYLDIVATS